MDLRTAERDHHAGNTRPRTEVQCRQSLRMVRCGENALHNMPFNQFRLITNGGQGKVGIPAQQQVAIVG